MKKRSFIAVGCAALALLTSCSGTGVTEESSKVTEADTTAAETYIETATPAPDTTKTPETEAQTEAPEATTAEATSADTTPALFHTLVLEWKLGYVGSATNSSYTNKLNAGGGMYSYSQIVKFPDAGTVITFTDDNTNSNGDSNFASASAYVISSWKQSGSEWVVDTAGYNVTGKDAVYSDNNGARTYTYTTTKANECLRFCFRSGQSSSFTPAAFPQISVNGGNTPTVIKETEAEAVEMDGEVITVAWNTGYVGSDTNPYGYANILNPGGTYYAYTDVIEVASAGTKLFFIDPNSGSTSGNAYVVSSWTKNGDKWELNLDGTNLVGSPEEVVSSVSGGKLYAYTTSKDGENIRLCYRSGGAEKTNPVKVYMKTNAGKGTVELMNESTADLTSWLKEDLTRADYSSVFSGKTMYVIGDSYFAGNGLDKEFVWPSLLAKKYSMTFTNYGINGSAISAYDTSKNPMVSRYTTMKDGNPDIVIIEGGKNDYNVSAPIGTVDSTDTKTFMGALRTLINGLKAKYPNAKIICVTPWYVSGTNSIGKTVQDYGTAMVTLCNSMGVSVINAQDRTATGVDMTDSSFRTQYCMTPSDISHLNLEGMKKVLPFFEKEIKNILTAN